MGRFINADGLIGQKGDILGHNLYAYVQNNPVMYYDPSGKIGLIIGAIIIIGVSVVLKADDPNTVIRDDLKSGKIYKTFEDASNAWGQKNGPLTGNDGLERGAFVYSDLRADGNTYYYVSGTYIGEQDNAVKGFIKGYIKSLSSKKSGNNLEGYLHTHPNQHYLSDNSSNADDFLMYLPGISRGYIYDTKGIGIYYDRYGSYDVNGNFYPSNSSNFIEAFRLLIINGHG